MMAGKGSLFKRHGSHFQPGRMTQAAMKVCSTNPKKWWILAQEKNFANHENTRYRASARELGLELELKDPQAFGFTVAGEAPSLCYRGKPQALPAYLLPRMGSGTSYYALSLIRQLELLGVKSLNSSRAIASAGDKLETLQLLAAKGLPVPKTLLPRFPLDFAALERELAYPLVLKPVCGLEGKGVFLCENRAQLADLARWLATFRDSRVQVMLQELVAPSRGRDLRVMVIGGKALGAMLRTAPPGGFKANYSSGGRAEAYPLDAEIAALAQGAARHLQLEIAGVDLLFAESGYKICEVNSSPGFAGFEKATGLKVPEAVFRHLKIGL